MTVGWYGKLPALGDFTSRRLPQEFVRPWDDWLQRSLLSSRARLGERWLDAYLHCPVWRFVAGPGVCGETAWAGVLMPSTDRVNRYFPLTVAAAVPWHGGVLARVAAAQGWFDAVEDAALCALDVNFTPEDLDAALPPEGPAIATDGGTHEAAEALARWWRGSDFRLEASLPAGGFGDSFSAIVMDAASRMLVGGSLWWRSSPEGPGRLFGASGLPDELQFTVLLDDTTTAR